MLGLGLQLQARGHSVVVAANGYFRGMVEDAGVAFHEVGQQQDYERAFASGRYEDGTTTKFDAVYRGCFEKSIEPTYRYVADQRLRHEDLLVICPHYFDSAALMACTQYGIKAVQLILAPSQSRRTISWPYNQLSPLSRQLFFTPVSYWRFYRSPRRRVHARWERRLRTGTRLSSVFHRPAPLLRIGLFPQWFLDEPYEDDLQRKQCQRDEPRCVGFPLFDQVVEQQRAEAAQLLAALPAPPIVFTCGTGIGDVDGFYSVSREVCRRLGVPGVLVSKDARTMRQRDDHLVRSVSYVDFEYLLERSRAIVHHGGIGTCARAIRAGIPQIIRPLEYDQPDNGWRIAQLGLGGMILRDDYRAPTAARYVARILSDTTVRSQIARYSARTRRDDALCRAADLVEGSLSHPARAHA